MDVSEIIGRKDKIMKTYMALVRLDDGKYWKEIEAESFREAEVKAIQYLDTVERNETDLITIERFNSNKCY